MKIEIHNYLSCSHLLEIQSGDWDSIVILDSSLERSPFVDLHSRNTLQLVFDDITVPAASRTMPEQSQIESALEFGLRSDKLIVCCRAGQSRSAAVAFAIVFEKQGEQKAMSILNPKRHAPNYKVLQLADAVIERPGLLNAYDKWTRDNGAIRLTDYLDEIASQYDQLESMGARDRISEAAADAE